MLIYKRMPSTILRQTSNSKSVTRLHVREKAESEVEQRATVQKSIALSSSSIKIYLISRLGSTAIKDLEKIVEERV